MLEVYHRVKSTGVCSSLVGAAWLNKLLVCKYQVGTNDPGVDEGGALNTKIYCFINNYHNPGPVIEMPICLACQFMCLYI